ncbi:Uncharacterized protein Adt_38918 [Abeliophyllum distichum]|uniref:Uncharacterized protein n=1 Tax=Abeliophyllum distichum TaxID=126358 RepID=A0ABD1Q4N3_9LAMI
MGQMAVAMSGRLQGTLPSNTKINPRERVHAITTRNGVQLPKIYVKRSVANKEKVPPIDEDHVEQTEQTIDIEENSITQHVKVAVPIKPYESPIHFPQRLNPKKKK